MEYLYQTALSLHKFFCLIFVGFVLVYFYISQRKFSPNYIKTIRLFLPAYYMVMALIAFTGLVILPIFDFKMSLAVVLMSVLFVYLIAINAIGYKKFKRAWKDKDFEIYKKFMRIVTALNLAFIALVSFI